MKLFAIFLFGFSLHLMQVTGVFNKKLWHEPKVIVNLVKAMATKRENSDVAFHYFSTAVKLMNPSYTVNPICDFTGKQTVDEKTAHYHTCFKEILPVFVDGGYKSYDSDLTAIKETYSLPIATKSYYSANPEKIWTKFLDFIISTAKFESTALRECYKAGLITDDIKKMKDDHDQTLVEKAFLDLVPQLLGVLQGIDSTDNE